MCTDVCVFHAGKDGVSKRACGGRRGVVVRRTLSARDAADAIGAVLADAVRLFDGGAGSTAGHGRAGAAGDGLAVDCRVGV
jgi:hypothetical protein